MGLLSTRFSNAVPIYTPEEWSALQRLRARYQQTADLCTERELAHLRFERWLVQTGRLVEDAGPAPRRLTMAPGQQLDEPTSG